MRFLSNLWMLWFISFNFLIYADDVWDAETYAQHSELQYKWALSYLDALKLKGDERILDIGCGDGRVTQAIAKAHKGDIVGIDSSSSMIEKANQLKGINLKFEEKDATQLGFDQEFDLVVSFNCFHWMKDYFPALQNIQRSLKPGGKVFLFFAPDYGANRLDYALDEVASQEKWDHFFTQFSSGLSLITPIHFLMLVEKAQLLLKRLEIVTTDEVFSSKGAFISWLTGWVPHLKYLPIDQREEFLEEVIACYLEMHPLDQEGNLHYIDYFMEVELMIL